MITFEYPFAFGIILLYIIALFFFKPKKEAFYFSNVKMLKSATKKQGFLVKALKFLIILALSTALASPIKKDTISTSESSGYEIALMLDMSGSMQSMNRFEIVKSILSDFIDKRENDVLGLSVYGDFAYIAVPLTYDRESIKRLLDRIKLGMVGTKTALYEGLFLTTNLFKDSTAKNKIIILPTDGVNTVNSVPVETAIAMANKYGIKVYTIGIGAEDNYQAEAMSIILGFIAKNTGGKHYYSTGTAESLQEIYDDIDKLEKSEIKGDRYSKKTYYFEPFLWIAFGLMVVLFLVTNRKKDV
ncbi:MAG: VWA domain-containing protein [Campylobacteraceae bacterium]|nr:VWA domain-containing protein [Campylobacteraceae bacterium]